MQIFRTLQEQWPLARFIAIAALVVGAFIALSMSGIAGGSGAQLWIARGWLTGGLQPLDDSWNVMGRALEWLRAADDRGQLYQEIFFEQGHKFQYAPTSLLFYEFIEILGAEPTTALMNAINRVVLGLTVVAAGGLTWLLATPADGGPRAALLSDASLGRLTASALAMITTLVFFPILYGYFLGQIQLWIGLLFLLAAICWKSGNKSASGVLLGVACLIKPQLGLFLVWGLLRREWKFSLALAATGALGLLASIMLYGFAANFAYLEVLSFISQHGESFRANQSVNGLMHRLFENGIVATWDESAFAPYNFVVHVVTLATTAALLIALFATRRKPGGEADFNDFLLAALVFTIASPVAWEHHYGVLLPVFAALVTQMAREVPGYARLIAGGALAVAFLLTASRFEAVESISSAPLNLLQSHVLAGGVIALLLLWRRTGRVGFRNRLSRLFEAAG